MLLPVRPREVSSPWLNMVIGSDYAQFYFMSRSKQSTNLASISSTNLMELPVVLPPTEEQKAIVSFLVSTLPRMEARITKSERAIDLLQERRTALISAAVTGQIDVRHAAPSCITSAREDQSFSQGATARPHKPWAWLWETAHLLRPSPESAPHLHLTPCSEST